MRQTTHQQKFKAASGAMGGFSAHSLVSPVSTPDAALSVWTIMKPFDPTKPCQTRDGRKVRILCTDAPSKSGHPILGVIEGQADNFEQWTSDGKHYDKQSDSIYDLINIPEKRKLTGWINMYPGDFFGSHYESKKIADAYSGRDRIACLDLSKYNIEFTEGEGL